MFSTQLLTICFNELNIEISYNKNKQLICKCSWPIYKKSYTTLKMIKQHTEIKVNTWNDYDNISYFFYSMNNAIQVFGQSKLNILALSKLQSIGWTRELYKP